jgi:hypothetical protein
MLRLKFGDNHQQTRHECRAVREGDWIVYYCPKCDYVRKEHIETRECVVKNMKIDIQHSGFYASPHYLNTIHDRN